MQFEIKGLLFY